MRGHNGRFVRHAGGVTTLLFAMRMPKLSRLAGGRAPKGRRGSHAHRNTTPDASMDKTSRKKGKITLVHGKPLRPYGPPPLQGRALKKSLFSKIHYHNASKDASICCKCNVFVHYLTYYKRFYLRFVGSSFKYRTFSVPSYKAEEFFLCRSVSAGKHKTVLPY